jgi:hypothetical protein
MYKTYFGWFICALGGLIVGNTVESGIEFFVAFVGLCLIAAGVLLAGDDNA